MADDAGSAEPRARWVCFGGRRARAGRDRNPTSAGGGGAAHPREAQSCLFGNQKM